MITESGAYALNLLWSGKDVNALKVDNVLPSKLEQML
jgi:hypothetical protein